MFSVAFHVVASASLFGALQPMWRKNGAALWVAEWLPFPNVIVKEFLPPFGAAFIANRCAARSHSKTTVRILASVRAGPTYRCVDRNLPPWDDR